MAGRDQAGDRGSADSRRSATNNTHHVVGCFRRTCCSGACPLEFAMLRGDHTLPEDHARRRRGRVRSTNAHDVTRMRAHGRAIDIHGCMRRLVLVICGGRSATFVPRRRGEAVHARNPLRRLGLQKDHEMHCLRSDVLHGLRVRRTSGSWTGTPDDSRCVVARSRERRPIQ